MNESEPEIAFKGKRVTWDPPEGRVASVQDLADALVRAMRLPVWPGSIEIHYSPEGLALKIDVYAVGWKRQAKT